MAVFNLSGKWKCNDNGMYYIRQVGEEVMWQGELSSVNPGWCNVAVGSIGGANLVLRWMDVPKGVNLSEGILVLKISPDGKKLTAVTREGGFGGSEWTKL